MDTTKSWYHSRTIWASIVAVGASAAGLLGLPVDAIDQAGLADTILRAVTAISGIVAVVGRISATTRIG